MNKKWFLVLFFLLLFACRKESKTLPPPIQIPQKLPPANGLAVTVTIDQKNLGAVIPENFEGLSYETAILTQNPEVLNINDKVFIQLIKNLGPGLLRIGGDSSDEIFWTGNTRKTGTGKDSLTTSDIDRLAAFSSQTGWPVLFGLNFGSSNIGAAVSESEYAYGSLQNNLYALQVGNEPDVYQLYGLRSPNYSIDDYLGEFETYRLAIRSTVPSASFAGPGIAYDTDFIGSFADNESNNVSMLDAHYYVAGPATDPSITYKTILSYNWKLGNLFNVLTQNSNKFSLPFRITECNSIYGGGKAGVSDIFASALWALDLMWTIASDNGQGINFHGGTGLVYSPITTDNGVITARPEYYAMLAFKYASTGGTIISAANNQPGYNCSTYAAVNTVNNTTSVTLINKDDINNLSFTIQAGKTVSNIEIAWLTAPAITSTTGLTFAGGKVKPDGTFVPAPTEYAVNQTSFVVNVPAGNAAVVTFK